MVCWDPTWYVDIEFLWLNIWYADIKLNMVYSHQSWNIDIKFWGMLSLIMIYWHWILIIEYMVCWHHTKHGMLIFIMLYLHWLSIIECMVYWHQTKHDMLTSNMVYCHWISILNKWCDNIKLNMVCWYPTWCVDIEFWNEDGFVVNGYSNVLMELTIVIRYINKKGYFNIITFHNIKRKFCWERIFWWKRFR